MNSRISLTTMTNIKTGCPELDELILNKAGILLLYGEGGSGKTTISLMAAREFSKLKGKVLFFDAENNFSTERFEQLTKDNYKDCMENVLLLNIKNFNLQHTQIKNLEGIKNVSLIIIDSLTHFYRRLYSREPEIAKAMLAKQLSILKLISKYIPIIVTSQVYSNMNNGVMPLAHDVLSKFCGIVIKLEKSPRRLFLLSPNKKQAYIKIVDEGIKIERLI